MNDKTAKNKKVSVIVPVYNTEKYLEQCLISLVNQTLKDIEIIIVNDGSPDNSQQIIEQYKEKYPNKIVSFIKENGGLSDARNYGINASNGEYLGFVDGDDYIDPTMFEKLYNEAVKKNSEIVVCDFTKDLGESLQQKHNLSNIEGFDLSLKENPELLLNCKSYVWNKIYKRDLFTKNNIQFTIGQYFEDSSIICNLLYYANKISVVPEKLYYYRTSRTDSVTNTYNERMFDIFKSCESILSFYSKVENYDSKFRDIVEYLCYTYISTRLKAIMKFSNNKLGRKFVNDMFKFYKKYLPNWKRNPRYIETRNKSRFKKTIYSFLESKLFLKLYFTIPNSIKNKILNIKKRRKSCFISKDRLKELQLIEVDILKEIDNVCKKNNITYYLGEGTLLGAIRHKGFIPWDDDLDILMLREDYEEFLKIAKEELPQTLTIINDKTFKNYYLPFTKIISKENHKFINILDKPLKENNGPCIDIFPLDYLQVERTIKQVLTFKRIRTYRNILLLKVKYTKVRSLKKLILKIASYFYSIKRLQKIIYKLSTKYNNKKHNYVINLASSYSYKKQTVPINVYSKPRYVKFEGYDMPVPDKAELLLTKIYGDYMTMPPYKKRIAKHAFYDKLSTPEKNFKSLIK